MLADAIGRALPELRAAAESLMQDAFTVYAPGDWEKVDGIEERVPRVVGTTPGKIAGGLHIPIGAEIPDLGWEYQLTTLGPNTDPALLNTVWQVVDVPKKSLATARRLDVVEIPQEAP
jgi:hypothetical protein